MHPPENQAGDFHYRWDGQGHQINIAHECYHIMIAKLMFQDYYSL